MNPIIGSTLVLRLDDRMDLCQQAVEIAAAHHDAGAEARLNRTRQRQHKRAERVACPRDPL